MKRLLTLACALAVGLTTLVAGEASAQAKVAAQLQMLEKSGTTVKYRLATAADKQVPGARADRVAADSRCTVGYVCIYPDANAGGIFVHLPSGQSFSYLGEACFQGICYNLNDRMSSWENASGWTYCWWFDADYKGERRFMQYHGLLVINVDSYENDKASSVQALAHASQVRRC